MHARFTIIYCSWDRRETVLISSPKYIRRKNHTEHMVEFLGEMMEENCVIRSVNRKCDKRILICEVTKLETNDEPDRPI
jgi:hypothetical protein